MSKKIAARKTCKCNASEHKLITNCLFCGKIICEIEGNGPCLFCSTPLPQNKEIESSDQPLDIHYLRALKMKNQLLDFDKSQIAENNIYDEQVDWYDHSENIWNTKELKEKSIMKIIDEKKQKEESKSTTSVVYNPYSQAWEVNNQYVDPDKSKKEAQEMYLNSRKQEKENLEKENNIIQIPESLSSDWRLKEEPKKIYEEIKNEFAEKYKKYQDKKEEKKPANIKNIFKRVNHDDFVEIFRDFSKPVEIKDKNLFDREIYNIEMDQYQCLSMLQPWASLLIEGFKRFEGRFWNTDYRGPLWIQSGSTPPEPALQSQIEEQYKRFYKDANMPALPEYYPLGSLLGVVDLETVLTNKEYNDVIPDNYREDSNCDFIFVVRNPRKLNCPIKMSGNKNIFKIPEDVKIKITRNNLIQVPINWFKYIIDEVEYSEKKSKNKLKIVEEQKENDKKDIKKIEEKKKIIQEAKKESPKKNLENLPKIKEIRNFNKFTEKISFSIQDYFKEKEIYELLGYIEQFLNGKKNWGQKNLISIENIDDFPFYKDIKILVNNEFNNKIKNIDFFYVNKKQNNFNIDKEYFGLLNIGANIEISVDLKENDETNSIEIKTGSFYCFDRNYECNFQFIDTKAKKDSFSLILLFK